MWDIIRAIIHIVCFLVITLLYGVPAIMVGIYNFKHKYESTFTNIFAICWGVFAICLSSASFIDYFFI